MSRPFKVKALYEYTSNHEDDLPFHPGQIITVVDEEDADWYEGEYIDDSGVKLEGIFPRNFVEKYEPTAPPRPTRIRKKETEASHVPDEGPSSPAPATPTSRPEQESKQSYQEPAIASPPTTPAVEPRSPPAPVVPVSQPPEPELVSAPAPPTPVAAPVVETPRVPSAPSAPSAPSVPSSTQPPTQAKKPPPPPVAGKSNAFKDRIAAFNKPAAPPVAPFKPGGLGSGASGFVKKPFVAPPPSRNAYIPPVQQAPAAKVYRRDEDPEIKERQVENQENAENAGLAPATTTGGEGEDQPKPTSLKERIALLQKQQAEQAQRHAEAAAAKKKPKRPPPKRTESDATQEQPSVADEAEAHPSPLERKDTAELASKKSLDVSRSSLDEASPPRQPPPVRRRSTKGPVENDGNEADMSGAGDTTEGPEDLTEKDDSDAQPKPITHAPEPAAVQPAEENAEEEGEEEEEDEDPEARRREELRARMAKMSGGMGFHGMFGPPGMAMGAPMPPKKKKPPTPERRSSEMAEPSSPRGAPPIPTMMALPGMGKQKQAEEELETEQGEATEQNTTPVATATSPRSEVPEQVPEPLSPTIGGAPPIPGSRPAPPPVPTQARPPPPPPPAAAVMSPGSESDDELSENPQRTSLAEAAPIARAPPPPVPVSSPPLPSSPRPSLDRGATRFSIDEPSLSSPPMSPQFNKRNSRPPPPPPSNAPPPTQGRPPPPPPPGGLSRPSTSDERVVEPMKPGILDNGEEAESTEYEGDYDTDIASSAPHKDALKTHARESSLEDNTPLSEAPPSFPPPLPATAAPSAGPPPIPSQPPPNARISMDKPRAPPPPPKSPPRTTFTNEDYDPFNYNSAQAIPSPQSFSMARFEDAQPSPEATPSYQAPPPPHGPPLAPQLPREPPRAPPRKSLDVQRVMAGRRSGDASRTSISVETGFMANEIDLAAHTNWWLTPNSLPPVFQGRKDIYSESTESTASTPEGRTVVTKEVFILYPDYSQTVITVLFDPQDPSSTEIDQRHELPPRTLRQDQLEQAYETYGRKIATAIAATRKDSVGDGTPHGLVHELLKPFADALRPVGTRAYGALVYANLANASTQMNDEIRPGDIVSFRNTKFSGKHGPMHAKYSTEVGKPDHVAVVAEWDGTKKKVRAWEQGRESKKCKQESFKLDDLRSGEVKVWRVMPRSWVGWSGTPPVVGSGGGGGQD